MARRKPAYLYKREADRAEARENYYRTHVPPEKTTVDQKNTKTLFYRSLLIKAGADHRVFTVYVGTRSLTDIGGFGAVGLLETLPANTDSTSIRRSGIKPSRIHWYKGDSTPTARRTPWGSRVIRYYDNTGNQSHFSTPVSKGSGSFTSDDLQTTFNSLFSPANGSKKGLLGPNNGRAWLSYEQTAQAYSSQEQ